ncbi:uncharacterized protein LOC117812951 isoform X2 [Notolabrus celidotus]|uniref:uncharacterized protein LOC117812951 isoform X2 n=1 Tax=Notolabrus celidotus TaxID=1203425 RepID=UPI00148FC6DC|nr:uncharacterized protein LOC117812951 isoform X2 [Notolabrus celidotus]
MENIQDPSQTRRASARRAERKPRAFPPCSCCRSDQDSNPHHSAPAARKKRKRASVARPSSSEHLAELTRDPAPQHSTHDAVVFPPVQRPQSTIPPAELPSVSDVVPSTQPSTAPPDDSPLMIHGYTVPEYQQIYHSVVDDMLRYKDGRLRPYSLDLGRRIKQKLWERLNRPAFTETVDENGLVNVNVSYKRLCGSFLQRHTCA